MSSNETKVAQLVLAHHAFVRGLAFKLAPWPGLVDDISQQVFLEFLAKQEKWNLNPFSWFSRQIPVVGNIEVTLQARLDAVVEEQGPLGYSQFGFTLILGRKHFNFMCERNPTGEGVAKFYSFVFAGPPRLEGGETDGRVHLPLAFQTGQTFQFKTRLIRLTPGQVQLQAKVWPQGVREPADWQLDTIRNAPLTPPLIELSTRRCGCTFTEMHVVLIE